ncbi:hypothetical protein V3C99_013890 [Haemonchus contortus]
MSVNRCTESPDTSLPGNIQENIRGIKKNAARYRVDAMDMAVKHWWSQVRKVDGIGMAVTYRAIHMHSTISYFTRMAWATTRFIGCAVSVRELCGDTWYVACHYKPGGNIVGDVVYDKGTPCSMCPMGFFCNPVDLCAAVTSFE